MVCDDSCKCELTLLTPRPFLLLTLTKQHSARSVCQWKRFFWHSPERWLFCAFLRKRCLQDCWFAVCCVLTKISTQEQELLVGKCLWKVRVPIAFNSFDHCVRCLFCISNRMVNRSGRNERMIRCVCFNNNSFCKTWSGGFIPVLQLH